VKVIDIDVSPVQPFAHLEQLTGMPTSMQARLNTLVAIREPAPVSACLRPVYLLQETFAGAVAILTDRVS
jgi:hypothetical protein